MPSAIFFLTIQSFFFHSTISLPFTAKVHLDQRTSVRLQGMRSSWLAANIDQRMVLDRWIAETRTDNRPSSEWLVRERWHRSPATWQSWVAAGWCQRELLGYSQQLLQRWSSLGKFASETIRWNFLTIIFPFQKNLIKSQHDVGKWNEKLFCPFDTPEFNLIFSFLPNSLPSR